MLLGWHVGCRELTTSLHSGALHVPPLPSPAGCREIRIRHLARYAYRGADPAYSQSISSTPPGTAAGADPAGSSRGAGPRWPSGVPERPGRPPLRCVPGAGKSYAEGGTDTLSDAVAG